jgi:hypothetical protein
MHGNPLNINLAKIKLRSAMFSDASKSLIRYEYEDKGGIKIEHVTWEPDSAIVKRILEDFTLEDLERNYVNWNKAEVYTAEKFAVFQEQFDEIMDYINGNKKESEPLQPKDVDLKMIQSIGNDQEAFFKLKLEIFELPEVRNSGNRAWKASMRKATTTLGLLALLYEVYSTLENEAGERLDETPPSTDSQQESDNSHSQATEDHDEPNPPSESSTSEEDTSDEVSQ